mgnify:CR=1 FL=1
MGVPQRSVLDRLKRKTETHLRRELQIMAVVLKLSKEDAGRFLKWYLRHPYRRGIKEVVEIVRSKHREGKAGSVELRLRRHKNAGD